MIHILHLVDELRRGGKERQLIELVRGIDKSQFQVHIISFLVRTDGYDQIAKGLSYKFSYIKRKFRWDILPVFQLGKYCKENKINLVYVWDSMTAFYALLLNWFYGVKFINGSIRDTDTGNSYRQIMKRIVLKLSRNVVANSYAGLKVYHSEKKGKVIYNGLDLGRFAGKQKKFQNKFIIGTVANLTIYKDYYTLFNAVKLLKDKIKDFEVWVIGGGKLTDVYKDYAGKTGVKDVVKFLGSLANPENYIINFDIGVLSSYKDKGEGVSNSVLEYMACGIPSVITNIGAAGEIVEHGKTGFLFEAGNYKDLVDKILLLYKNKELRREIGAHGKDFISNRFSYLTYIKETEEYYRKLVTNAA